MPILNYLISVIVGFVTAWFAAQYAPADVAAGAGLSVTWLLHKYLDPIFLAIQAKLTK